MLIISQNKDKTTESLEFSIKEKETCKNIFIDEKRYQLFKEITQKKDNFICSKEMKVLERLIGQNIRENIYLIIEEKRNRTFGVYKTKEKAKNTLKEIAQEYEKGSRYQLQKDEDIGMIIL